MSRCALNHTVTGNCSKNFHWNFQIVKVTIDNDGNFLRKSVNDITSLLDINFGSLGRPARGGRGRGGRGGQSDRQEKAHPILERVCYTPEDKH